MVLSAVLILMAIASAGVVAFGADPGWGRYSWGLRLILLSRRLEWPLILMALLGCLVLIALVAANKRRAWWLLGLLPVLALFYRVAANPTRALEVLDTPAFVSADEAAKRLHGDDHVVGLLLGDTYYAYPYATLFVAPVVVQPDQARRMMLMWSAYANHATAVVVGRDFKPRELEIVSTPANALLLYNARLGQFINALTGLTVAGEKPVGFGMELTTEKMPWKQWVALHPQTRVLAATGRERPGTGVPLKPIHPLPTRSSIAPTCARVAVLATTQPVAVVEDHIGADPENFVAGQTAVLLFRDSVTGRLRAFSRDIGDELTPRFRPASNPARPNVLFVDADAGLGWDRNGVAVDGDKQRRGQKLVPIHVEEGLTWGVMKYWDPRLELQPTGRR